MSSNDKTTLNLRHPHRTIIRDDYEALNIYFFLHIISLIFGFIFLLPIRVFLCLFVLIVDSYLLRAVLWFYNIKLITNTTKYLEEPAIPEKVQKIVWIVGGIGFRLLVFFSGVLYIEKVNLKNIKKNSRVFVAAPHSHMFDNLVPPALFNRTWTGLMASPEKDKPITNVFFKICESYFVDYSDPISKKNAILNLKHRAISEKWKHYCLMVFPEGTTGDGTKIYSFKKGIFTTKTPVQPIRIEWIEWMDYIIGNRTLKRKNTRGAGWGAWTDDITFGFYLLYTLCTLWHPVIVEVLPEYVPSDKEKNDPNLYAENVRDYIITYSRKHISSDKSSECEVSSPESATLNNFDVLIVAEFYTKSYYNKIYKNLDKKDCNLFGGSLEQEFGSKNIKKSEITKWIKEWVETEFPESVCVNLSKKEIYETLPKTNLNGFVRNKLLEKTD